MAETKKEPFKFPTEYWMITAEWDQLIEVPQVDEGGRPILGEPRRFIKKMKVNQAIAVHPVVHGVAMLTGNEENPPLQNFVVTMMYPIPKRYFDLVTAPSPEEEQIDKMATKVEGEKKDTPPPPGEEQKYTGPQLVGGP